MIALLLGLILASTPQQPTRDTPREAAAKGTIEGRVIAPDGKTPLRRAVVRLTSASLPRRLTTRADLQGRYTFPELPEGRYTLSASKPGYLSLEFGQRRPYERGRRIELAAAERLAGLDIVLPPSGSISGVVIDDGSEPVYQMWVSAARLAYRNGRRTAVAVAVTVTNDIGEFRLAGLAPGDYYIITRERDGRVREFSDEPVGFGTTVYPGAATLATAQPVRVVLGQQVAGISVPVIAARTAVISGRAVDDTGRPMPSLQVSVTDGPDLAGLGGVLGGTSTDSSGAFRIAAVRPGVYSLHARAEQRSGDVEVDVREQDISGITLVVGSGGSMSGRVVTPDGAPGTKAGLIQLCALATGSSRCTTSAGRIATDGTFSWQGIRGDRLVRAFGVPDGWWLKAVMHGERNVTDVPLALDHGTTIGDLQVVLDDEPAVVSGTVVSEAGAPVSDYTAIVFAADETRWNPESRFIASERPDHEGTFRVAGLPPGDYLVAAVEWVEEGQWLDEQYLRGLRRAASKLVLEQGKKADVRLTLVK